MLAVHKSSAAKSSFVLPKKKKKKREISEYGQKIHFIFLSLYWLIGKYLMALEWEDVTL